MAKPRSAKKGGRAPQAAPEQLPEDMYDEVDKFHKQRDTLALNVDEDGLSEDSLDEEVLGMGSDSDGSDSYDTDDEIEAETKYGKLAKQAKSLGARLRIEAGEDEAGGEGAEGEDGERRGWGASKRSYYGADLADLEGSEDEEAMADEEEEALRLQREAAAALRPEDFEQSEEEEEEEEGGSSEEESEEEDEADGATMGAAAAAAGAVRVERVTKDLSGLSSEQRLAAVQQDAPELLQLIAELREGLTEVRSRVGPLLKEVREGDLATAEGVSYLEAKHLLLLHYCTAIVFYLLLKAEGRAVQSHPVIGRLVEARAYLEKIRPIDKKLQYQIEKLLKATAAVGGKGAEAAEGGDAAAALAGGEDPLRYGPRPDALQTKQGAPALAAAGGYGEDGGQGGDGVYRPPRLNPVSMEFDERGGDLSAKDRRQLMQAQRRASRSGLMQELAAEMAGAPEEQRHAAPGMDTAAALRERQRLAQREDVEEELMIRVPLSKEERKRLKSHRREGLSGKVLLDDFADEVGDILGGENGASGIDAIFQRHTASQKWGADLSAQAAASARKSGRSGDADLPVKDPLHERRAKFDSVRARQQISMDEEEGPEQLGGGKRRRAAGEEDEFYQEAKAAAAVKKSKKRETYLRPETLPPVEDPSAAGARGITRDIEKNRGLTPHRRKDMKNPRKKHRVKFAQATERRKGQVQEVRKDGGSYGGEATGIKSRLSKSVKL